MSRRIFLPTVAAIAALIAPQALADSDCFENSCRMPAVVEPPAPPPPAPPPEPMQVDVVRPVPAQPTASPVQTRREVVQQAPQIVDEPLVQRLPSQRVAPPPVVRAVPVPRAVAEPRIAPEPQRPVRVVTPRPLVAEAPARPDSDWQLCQPDPRVPGYLRCGASVGQPARAPAARPYADVRSYQMLPSYIGAPNARIIHLEADDD